MATNLNAAFAALRRMGLFARQNYTCCQSCGWAAVDAALAGRNRRPVGCVFYHAQDADELRAGRDFRLAYGRAGDEPGDTPTEKVGQIVAQVLQQHGVEVEWDGNPTTRILVKAASVRNR